MCAIHPESMAKIRRLLDLPAEEPVTLEHLARAYEMERAAVTAARTHPDHRPDQAGEQR